MVTWLRAAYDGDTIPSFLTDGAVDPERFAHTLDRLDHDVPVVIFAVTSALLRLADWADTHGSRWHIPAGSLIIDTGGCKGYDRDVSRDTILERYRRLFDIVGNGTMLATVP